MSNNSEKKSEFKLSIPDEDMTGWVDLFVANGFSREEMDVVFSHLNKNYARERLRKFLDEEVNAFLSSYENEARSKLSPEKIEKVREFILQNLQEINLADLEKGQRPNYAGQELNF